MSDKKPGIMLQISDGKKVIVYNEQPFLASQKKIMMHIVDDDGVLQYDESGKQKIVTRTLEQYNLDNQQGVNKVIGFVD